VLLGASLSLAARSSGEQGQTEIRATKPPQVLVQNSCNYGDQNSAYGSLTLFVAIPVTRAFNGEAESGQRVELYSLHCGMGARATVNTSYVCDGAYLDMDSLIRGEALSWATSMGPISREWNHLEFRVVERTGALFRLSSRHDDPLLPGHITQATISADLATGRVSYVKHEEGSGKIWDERGEARCGVRGWTPKGPAKPYWEK
jgi:hypothetical protein